MPGNEIRRRFSSFDASKDELDDGLIRARTAAQLLSISRSTFYAWIKEGRIRQGIKLGPSVTCWPRAYIRTLMTDANWDGGIGE